MTSAETPNALTGRALAAQLFAAAARHDRADATVQLRCLAACSALQNATGPVPPVPDRPHPDELITRALRALGELAAEDFAHPAVLDAARHGRRALLAAG